MKKILVADDEPDQRRLVKLILRKYDCKVIEAQTGLEAIEQAKKEVPDLILIDHLMPEMQGYEAIQVIRKEEALKKIPIIMFTSKKFDAGFKDWVRQEVAGFIEKPLSGSRLIPVVEQALGALRIHGV